MRKALQYTKKLEGVGLSREQAEAHLEVLNEIFEDDVATKDDLKNFESRVELRFQSVELRFQGIDARFDQVDARFKQVDVRFDQLEEKMSQGFKQLDARIEHIAYQLITKMGVVLAASVGIVAAIFRFLI
ncbi:hypothetical protein COB52_04740 [Candidatus Kaiserbacteria bacterium]|nr:MAG: hypothetical protein COB52_04740 [Candidatus Kaiserbacteria bacterium]